MKYIVYIIPGAIVGLAALIIGLVFGLRHRREYKLDKADEWLVNEFSRCNVIVFGKKGSGKDLIFAHVIALRNDLHYSNIPYNGNTEIISLKEVSAGDNTFQDCVEDTINKFMPRFEEGCDIYLSDCGVYLPSDCHEKLNDLYPSMPLLYALSRQLYKNNIHANTQALSRIWIKLREQADSYIQVLGNVRRGDIIYVKIRAYDKYRNAENQINPTLECTVRVPIYELQYDTRYFRGVFFDRELSPFERAIQFTDLKGVIPSCTKIRQISGLKIQ